MAGRRQSFGKCTRTWLRKLAPKFEAPLRYAPFRFKFHPPAKLWVFTDCTIIDNSRRLNRVSDKPHRGQLYGERLRREETENDGKVNKDPSLSVFIFTLHTALHSCAFPFGAMLST